MHGTLLGWWWNRQVTCSPTLLRPGEYADSPLSFQILPWDSDVDVQISEPSMYYLAAYYNMSVFHYRTPRIPDGRDYMLEINPHYKIREQSDKLNVIDARWIDTESGLFIDITSVRYNLTHPDGDGMMSCKDGHAYKVRASALLGASHQLMASRTHSSFHCATPYSKGHPPRFPFVSKTYCSQNMGRSPW